MTGQQIKNIATDAALLLDELKDLEFANVDAFAMVVAAMPAIVTQHTGGKS